MGELPPETRSSAMPLRRRGSIGAVVSHGGRTSPRNPSRLRDFPGIVLDDVPLAGLATGQDAALRQG
jgi:hypothetical protein